MDRVTVLCCSNMSRTDKRKLLVIGKSIKPRCFKRLRMDSLPVVYRAIRNARMTSELLKEWLKDWDRELQPQSRKVMVLLGNCSTHPHLDCLKNIQLEFLPPTATALVQPTDIGIIKNLKTLYCASWRKVSSESIQNCFSHCGLKHLVVELDVDMLIQSENDDGDVELQQVQNCEEFLSIYNELQYYDENEDYDAAIVARVAAKHTTASEDQESDDDDDIANKLVQMTTQDARKCIESLRRYFMQEENEGSPTAALDVCGDFIHVQSVKRTRQITLDKFFKC
ncbi:Tigger transposable element-derived protein 4, partial [Stegodyphus mimosarum]